MRTIFQTFDAGYILFLCLVISILTLPTRATAGNAKECEVRVAITLPAEVQNSFYQGNRSPLVPSPLIKLPIQAIQPAGWLRHQLELMADGFTGHLTEISQWCRFEGNAWVNPNGQGQSGWEELPYWLKGFIDLGYILNDQRIIQAANRWVEGVLTTQDLNGYFGPQANRREHDIWPNMIMLYVLRTHYQATGDARIIPFISRYFKWLNTVPLEHFLAGSWQKIRGGDNLDHIYWLYNQTGERWLLDLARLNHERTADWTGGIPTWHGVNICQGFREPAQYYQQTGDRRFLQATERNYYTVMELYGQVPGGMFGADENARPGYSGPRQGAETCSMVEFMHSDEMLLKITGDPLWAERCEEIALNSLPASMTPDLKGLHYLTAPNMVQLDRADKAPLLENSGDMLSYNPRQYRCCQHNVAFGWPYFAEHLWLATADNGLAVAQYAPATVKAKVGNGAEVLIRENTDYPFDEAVEFTFTLDKKVNFPLWLRIPAWCTSPRISINGESLTLTARPLSWVMLKRVWQHQDVVRLELPMSIQVLVWKSQQHAISVKRGPLYYALKIGEGWQRVGGTDDWPAYEVYPTTHWNYGLLVDLQNPTASFEVQRTPTRFTGQAFAPENAPIELRVKGRRLPAWKLEANGLIGNFQGSPVRSSEPLEELSLVPMGTAHLRVTVFPRLSESLDANEWE